MQALAVVRAEHRSLAAVLHGLVYLVREARGCATPPDFALLGAMLRYVDAFPERFHHPKEDAFLFARLRERHPPSAALLDGLAREHEESPRHMRELTAALARWQACVVQGRPDRDDREAFAAQADAYAAFHWEHMRREELEVMPLCAAHLTPEDWAGIDAAFGAHADPLSDTSPGTEFDELFRRIVASAPPPVGTRR
jgi:hemerythrin-like domain-containing protein